MSEEPPHETGADPRRQAGSGIAPAEDDRPAGSAGPTGPGGYAQPAPASPADPSQPGGQVDRSGRLAGWLGGSSLVLNIIFPLLGFVTGIVAIVIGRRARRRAKQQGTTAPGAKAGITMGVIGVLIMPALVLALVSVLWTEMSGYQRCVTGANTHTDKQACLDTRNPRVKDKQRRIETRLDLPEGSLSQYGDLNRVLGG